MSSKAVLKSSFIGYIYRGMRAVGVVLTIAGLWHLGDIFFHSFTGTKAVATISRLQVVCALQGQGSMSQVVRREVECSEADNTRAQYPGVPIDVGEITYGYFLFSAEDGTSHEIRAPLEMLEAQGAENGSAVAIVYDPANPAAIRPALPVGAMLRSLSFLSGGVAILFAVLTVRWIASHRRGIEVDVARLETVHSDNIRRTLRLPITAPAPPVAPSPQSSIRRR